ncbi:MAG: siphovirus Gp157 family protein [Haemophilus parainfluenzae]|nr:siphovirus Gp157 family protein [Haemophilus parainfluenzae]
MRMAEALKAQEAEFAQMRKRKERAMERLKGLCLTYLTLTDKRQAAGDLFTIKRRKNPARVIVSDEAAIPREFIREKVTTSVDKTAIKKALNAGQAVTGAFLEQGESVVFE